MREVKIDSTHIVILEKLYNRIKKETDIDLETINNIFLSIVHLLGKLSKCIKNNYTFNSKSIFIELTNKLLLLLYIKYIKLDSINVFFYFKDDRKDSPASLCIIMESLIQLIEPYGQPINPHKSVLNVYMIVEELSVIASTMNIDYFKLIDEYGE